jgi:hypothetical protein
LELGAIEIEKSGVVALVTTRLNVLEWLSVPEVPMRVTT